MPDSQFPPSPDLVFNKDVIPSDTSICQVNSSVMRIEYNPHLFPLIFLLILGLFTLGFIMSQWYTVGFICGFLILLMVCELSTHRAIWCEINKDMKSITYDREGWVGLPWGRQHITCELDSIEHVEMKRHINRWRDTFSVEVCFIGSTIYPISDKYLSFSECQRFAEIVRDFIDSRLPISAVD